MVKSYYILDFIKFFMALVVVAIHAHPERSCQNEYLNYLLTNIVYPQAVPFFFVTSGFLLWRKIIDIPQPEKVKRINSFIQKSLRLYIVWTLIYLPFTIYGFYTEETPFLKSLLIFLRNFTLVGENYLSWPLWYLLAMITGGICLIMMSNLHFSKIFTIAIFLYLTGIGLDYMQVYDENCFSTFYFKLFKTTRNGFFVGFAYIMIGGLIALYEQQKSSTYCYIVLFILGTITSNYGIRIASLVVSYSFFKIILSIKVSDKFKGIAENARMASTIIFLTHMIPIAIFRIFLPNMPSLATYIYSILFTLSISAIAIVFREKKIIKVLF